VPGHLSIRHVRRVWQFASAHTCTDTRSNRKPDPRAFTRADISSNNGVADLANRSADTRADRDVLWSARLTRLRLVCK
jgi:hypothetical protein